MALSCDYRPTRPLRVMQGDPVTPPRSVASSVQLQADLLPHVFGMNAESPRVVVQDAVQRRLVDPRLAQFRREDGERVGVARAGFRATPGKVRTDQQLAGESRLEKRQYHRDFLVVWN